MGYKIRINEYLNAFHIQAVEREQASIKDNFE
jgi:hypothetical protein